MRATALKHWLTGAAYNYADGDLWPDLRHHTPMMVAWRIALTLGIRSREAARSRGDTWPKVAATMIGDKRCDNIIKSVLELEHRRIDGCFVDCGVWRGGSTILMTQAQCDYAVKARTIYCCDTFEGFIASEAAEENHHTYDPLKVSQAQVRKNFEAYDVSTRNVVFLQGDVKTTMPKLPEEKVALLRIDVDMGSPTKATLDAIYPKMPSGGIVIVDDYGCDSYQCKTAVDIFLTKHPAELIKIDGSGVWWRKP